MTLGGGICHKSIFHQLLPKKYNTNPIITLAISHPCPWNGSMQFIIKPFGENWSSLVDRDESVSLCR
jgi:hypothetical protein